MRKLTDIKKLEAIKLLLQGVPQQEIAARLGLHRNTITNWKKDVEFQEMYRRYCDEYLKGEIEDVKRK